MFAGVWLWADWGGNEDYIRVQQELESLSNAMVRLHCCILFCNVKVWKVRNPLFIYFSLCRSTKHKDYPFNAEFWMKTAYSQVYSGCWSLLLFFLSALFIFMLHFWGETAFVTCKVLHTHSKNDLIIWLFEILIGVYYACEFYLGTVCFCLVLNVALNYWRTKNLFNIQFWTIMEKFWESNKQTAFVKILIRLQYLRLKIFL